jgi:DNA-binding NtrC family response regulator
MNIVVLEDDADTREAMAALLSLDQHIVAQAHDSASFRRATSDLSSQAVIFDLHLADESSGLSLAMDYQTRRCAAGLPQARLIALSGSADPDAVIAQARTPFPVHCRLRKPANLSDIQLALNP